MTTLAGEIAFRSLREALEGKREASHFVCEDLPFERLRLAIVSDRLSAADRAIRLRHALRFADLALPVHGRRTLPLPTAPSWPGMSQWSRFGLKARAGGIVEAEPWRPTWLADVPEEGVDATAMHGGARPWLHAAPAADPFVTATLGFNKYKGPGQALAVRCSLHLPERKTLLVLLPTGEGKSLIFQSISAAHPGACVAVVVPTVALALDHAAAIAKFPGLATGHPHAYVGGRTAQNAEIVSRVAAGTQGLLFASPEATVKGLRQPLLTAARSGHLAAVVIDEAHLVNSWGVDFRSHFQMLAALVAEIRENSPTNRMPKVICLSATVTQDAMETLERLFSPDEPLSVIPSARLRPEPEIWIASPFDEQTRQHRVLEALRHLPRPAILYVTKQNDAERWMTLLKEEGFRSLALVHGSTDTDSREETIKGWRRGDIDLAVGTSAFGLGIDYPHVRTVIHACVPESLDRYYQEIGRSGRDNRASIGVLLPTAPDFNIAKRLALKRIISKGKALARWRAMFGSGTRDRSQPLRFFVDISAAPAYNPDMKSAQHEDWNGRVLNLMSLSGFIKLAGIRYDKGGTLIGVDILHDGHTQQEMWESQVEPVRKGLVRSSWVGYQLMVRLAMQQDCPSTLLSALYRLQYGSGSLDVLAACGGCAHCRKGGKEWFAVWPNALPSPWPIGAMSEAVAPLFDEGRCLVARDGDSVASKREVRRIKELFLRLWQAGFKKCIIIGEAPIPVHEVLCELPWCVAVGTDYLVLASNGLPPGPEVIWVSAGCDIPRHHLGPRPFGNERLFVLAPAQRDVENPGSQLSERIPLMPLNKLHDRVLL